MPELPIRYWDACAFLSYINGTDSGRLANIDPMLAASSRGEGFRIVTSTLSVVEVAFGKTEQDSRALDAGIEGKINKLWAPGSPVTLVEFFPRVAEHARALVRRAMAREWSLRAADAIHLATADIFRAVGFDTYDKLLAKFAEITDTRFPIGPPVSATPGLGLTAGGAPEP